MAKLFIISGPSGVGKTTIRKTILEKNPNLWYSISMTTRKKRNDEINGKDYYFVSQKEFIKNINNNNFLEYVEVYKNIYYGTPKDKVTEKLNNNTSVILEIDVDGALKIKNEIKESVLIFITAKNIITLKNRLIKRNTDSTEIINERIKKVKYELSKKEEYDYIIVNEDLNIAIKQVDNIIKSKI